MTLSTDATVRTTTSSGNERSFLDKPGLVAVTTIGTVAGSGACCWVFFILCARRRKRDEKDDVDADLRTEGSGNPPPYNA